MNLFLQGEPGTGKSFLLRQLLSGHVSEIEGFTVQRLYREGKIAGFRAVIFDGKFEPIDAEYDPEKSGIFISTYKKDLSILEYVINQVEYRFKNESCKIVLLDEVGGIELASENFQKSLYSILEGGRLCIGVLKSEDNLKRTLRNNCIYNEYLDCHRELVQKITGNGYLYTMTPENKNELRPELLLRLNSYMGRG